MPGSDPVQFLPPVLGTVLALLCLVAAYRAGRRRRLIDHLPTSKTTGVFIGLVELKGTAESHEPLITYLAGGPCVYYTWTVDERWSRMVTETYTDSDGKTKTRTRHESGWKRVDDGGGMIPFRLFDDRGAVQVVPDGATIEPVVVFRETVGRSDPLYYGKGPAGAVSDSDGVRRFEEQAIPLHADIYVLGQARERTDVVAPEIAADPEAPMFLISTRTEQQVSSGHARGCWGWGIFGFVLAVAGWPVRDGMLGRALDQRWPVYLLPAAGYLAAVGLAWTWLAFNSLIDLRQRVRQAWAQVEVQLKRRHDLIPNLVQVVTTHRDYEQSLQTELAALRTQLQATPPGVAGPNPHALKQTVLAIAERYPELKTDGSFSRLQRHLIDTEERIALARGYFNDIATHWNTRLETVPDRFVAQLAAMRPQPLMEADAFERAPVPVTLGAGAVNPAGPAASVPES